MKTIILIILISIAYSGIIFYDGGIIQSMNQQPMDTIDKDNVRLYAHRFVIDGQYEYSTVLGTGSMMPTIKNTSLLILITYEGQELKVNDIVIFKVPDKNNSVVHRILGFKNDFIITKGDNNLNIDQWDTVKENITYVVGGIIYT